MASLSVIVPATNAPATLEACLAAIAAADDPPDEVVVVDDPAVGGAAAARNRGTANSTGELIVFVDADVVVHRDALSRIRAAFAADPDLVGVFGSYDDEPPGRGPVSGFRNLLHHHVHQAAAGEARTFWAGLGALRRRTFDEFGGFVEHPVEDIELGMRLCAAGARIRLDPEIQGTHLKTWSLITMVRTDLFVRGAPWVGLLLQHRAPPVGLNLGWRHRLSALASLALVAAVPLRSPFLAGGALAALVTLNRSFYLLLARRRGPLEAAVGVALHVVHHLVAILALPVGIVLYTVRRWSSPQPPHDPVESPTA